MENLNLFIKSIFIDNMIFAYFLGMCSFLAVSKNVKTAFGLGIAVSFVLIIALPVTWCINTYVLQPAHSHGSERNMPHWTSASWGLSYS